jgi:fructose-1,6-bisphosphatase/inositol monophosphatase family enzyme
VTYEMDFATSLARRAGSIMREHFRTGVSHTSKSDGSPVTEADMEINDLVAAQVRMDYPGDGFIGEEGGSVSGASGRVWVCDPIDGTLPFTLGVPTNMFSLALVEDGVPILGVLYDPYLNRLYEGLRGRGATVNGSRLQVNDSSLAGSIVSVPTARLGLTDNAALAAAVISGGSRIFNVASIAYVGSLVAAGQISACVYPATAAWDVAAVKIIVEEAGGRVTDVDGNPQRYDEPVRGALISNGRAHDDLVALVQRHLLDTDAL